MKKIMKLNGCVETMESKTYEWVCGETEFNLVYDNDGDLYGIEIDGIDQNILDDIVEKPWNYDFPTTMEDYISELPNEEIELPMNVVYDLEAMGQRLEESSGYFLMLLEIRPRCYNFPNTGFNIWCDEFDRTYQIDIPKALTKEELLDLYHELKDLEDIYDVKLI